MSKKPFGWIYRIFHKNMPNQCYIGRTEVGIKKRFEGHLRDAKKANKKGDGDAKLYKIMWAHQPDTFKVEEIDTAKDLIELKDKDGFKIMNFKIDDYTNRVDENGTKYGISSNSSHWISLNDYLKIKDWNIVYYEKN